MKSFQSKVLKADEKETLFLIANAYLEVIQRFLSQRKDFDFQQFYDDAKALFEENGVMFFTLNASEGFYTYHLFVYLLWVK